jgi:hypothetical protein
MMKKKKRGNKNKQVRRFVVICSYLSVFSHPVTRDGHILSPRDYVRIPFVPHSESLQTDHIYHSSLRPNPRDRFHPIHRHPAFPRPIRNIGRYTSPLNPHHFDRTRLLDNCQLHSHWPPTIRTAERTDKIRYPLSHPTYCSCTCDFP